MAKLEITEEIGDLLKSALQEQYASADTAALDQELSDERATNIDYYLNKPTNLVAPPIGRSKVVSQDVSDVVDGLLPGLLEVVLGEPPVSFIPQGRDDDEAAENETAACAHVLHAMNPGFLVVHDALKAGLLERDGYIKVYTEPRETTEVEELTNVQPEALDMIDGEIETTPSEEAPGMVNARVTRKVMRDRVIVACVPTEDVRVSARARGAIDESDYVSHDVKMTRAQLLKLGVEEEIIDQLDEAAPSDDDKPEQLARRAAAAVGAIPTTKGLGVYDIVEHFIVIDVDGDGNEEKILVHTSAKDMIPLSVQLVEDHDFASWSPIRVPHRHHGLAVADKARAYMDIKTSLLRNLMDGFYHSVNPRPVIGDDIANEFTMDDYLLVQPGRPIRTAKTLPLPMYQPMPTVQHAGPVIDMMDTKQEFSTGFARAGVAINKNSFNQTATGADILSTAQQAMQKLYARMFVETGLTRVYKLIHRHLRASNIETLPIQVNDQWQDVKPREWKPREFAQSNLNLGPSTQQQDQLAADKSVMLTSQLIQLQKGVNGPFVYPANIHAVARNFYEVNGKKNFSKFINDPTEQITPQRAQQLGAKQEAPQPPVSPEVQAAMIQAEAFKQVETLKAELKMQTTLQVEQMKGQIDIMIARMEAMIDQKLQEQRQQLDHQAKLHANVTRPQPAFESKQTPGASSP